MPTSRIVGRMCRGGRTRIFEELTGKVCRFAERHDIPNLSTHGGGYKRRVAVEAAVRHVDVLASIYNSNPI
jgi:acetoin utilization deacetylase AcuC-like enzyme